VGYFNSDVSLTVTGLHFKAQVLNAGFIIDPVDS